LGSGMVAFYAVIFRLFPGLLNSDPGAKTWFTPFYFSIVTFTTLGFGDVRPACAMGQIIASTEVILGYITLGLLLAVLAEKLARRS
jgi:Ion channel